MKRLFTALALALTILGTSGPASALTDVVQYSTGYFTPDPSSVSGQYYRWYNEDWGWQHSAVSGSFTSATLSISAWDVDWQSGEVDKIYAYDNGVKTLIGTLSGEDSKWSYTTFTLGANFFDDIAAGLKVYIDIDTTHESRYWAVALAKSVLLLDGGSLPDPEPGAVPEPSTMLLLGGGLAGLAFWRRRKQNR